MRTLFVSIQARPYTWLRAPLQRGDLPGARSAATELPQINLADALAIVLLMAADDDAAFARERVTTAIVDAPGETVSPARGAA